MNTRRIVRSFYRSWWRRPFSLVMTFIVVPLIVGRIALNPLLEKTIRRHLAGLGNIATANFADLDVFLFPPSFTFRDVSVRGPSGEALDVDRLEIHLGALRDLRGPVPHARLRLVHPHLRMVTGSGDLERWVRALPAAYIDVTGVEKGTIVNAAAADGRPMFQDLNGDIEGLATGRAPHPATGVAWQTWLDGRLDGNDPLHAFVKVDPAGSWEANITVQQRADAEAPAGSGPVAVDVRSKGRGAQARAVVNLSWPGPEVPVALAQDRVNRLSAKWPISNLSVAELRVGSGGTGQSLQVVLVNAPPDAAGATGPAAATATPSFNAAWAGALVVDAVRLSNQALLPPPRGVASLTATPGDDGQPAVAGENTAAGDASGAGAPPAEVPAPAPAPVAPGLAAPAPLSTSPVPPARDSEPHAP